MKDLIPFAGDRRVHRALDDVLGRQQVMGVLSGLVLVRLVRLYMEAFILAVLGGETIGVEVAVRLAMWHLAFVGGVVVAAYWHQIEKAVEEATES